METVYGSRGLFDFYQETIEKVGRQCFGYALPKPKKLYKRTLKFDNYVIIRGSWHHNSEIGWHQKYEPTKIVYCNKKLYTKILEI